MFRDIKLPLGNDMRHWNDLFWSLWQKIQKKSLPTPFGGGKKKTHRCFIKILKLKEEADEVRNRVPVANNIIP